jgi:hypothetical protein
VADEKDEEREGNLATAFVAVFVFKKNLVKAAFASLVGGKPFGEALDEFMERDCKPFATKKRSE